MTPEEESGPGGEPTGGGGSRGEGAPEGRDVDGKIVGEPTGADASDDRHGPAPRLRWKVVGAAAGTAAVLVVAAGIASVVSVPYYAITPGSGVPVSSLVAVPRRYAHSHLGGVMLTDVELVPLRALSYLYYELDSSAQVVPSSELVGTATSSEYQQQGIVDMADARQAATVVALDTLGYRTRAVPSGVTVYQPEPGTAAARGLAVGDVITAVDGSRVRTVAGLVSAIGAHSPGESVALSVHKLVGGAARVVRIRLGEIRASSTAPTAPAVCAPVGTDTSLPPVEVHGAPAPCVGIVGALQAYTTVGLPFPVSLSADGIQGPSAGLAFTLGLIEKLDSKDLTAGLKIAATGTMSVTGQVGDVGGVAQKTIAVRDAGAALFFVPPQEYATAQAHAGPNLKVLAVSTIAQAVADLEGLGGQLVLPSHSH
ncbi:MAG: PDZ domain-containing protein [Actinomycetota bacterium]|nr:PDZ domain-containing protein [Actinomycetota bacterium]